MSILDLGNEEVPLPVQIVLDTSLLLACREGDDNPCSKAAKKFIQRLGHLKASANTYPVEERIRHFITSYYLLPQDALILAEAERLGVTAVATLDRDWHRVKEFDVYTTPV